MTIQLAAGASAAALILLGCAPAAGAQTLASRIAAAPDGAVQFTFAAREGVCGNGRTYMSTGPNQYSGSFVGSLNETVRADPCVPGPVRVVLGRANGQVISIDSYVGPPSDAPGASNLGTVSAPDAARYLFDLAARLEGSPSRAAILPAMLADSAETWTPLLALARDQARPLDTRRSAISWLARDAGAARADAGQVTGALLVLARDASDRPGARSSAVSALARLDQGAGIPALTTLARAGDDAWLAKESADALARSGDPRARRFLREAAESPALSVAVRRSAIRGLGRSSYATGDDVSFLRAAYTRAAETELKDEILRTVAGIGGAENASWLLAAAQNEGETVELRRKALQYAARGDGLAIGELAALYDRTGDRRLKQELISLLARRPEPAATDKLIAIARTADDRTLQRLAISRLSRSEEPRVREALEGIIARP